MRAPVPRLVKDAKSGIWFFRWSLPKLHQKNLYQKSLYMSLQTRDTRLSFGAGMVVSGSCISAHWYRLAEGSMVSPFALVGSALGFILGFKTWNPLYSLGVADAPVIWLPAHLGYAGALLVQLGWLALLAA